MKQITREESKNIQMDIMDTIQNFCVQNDIRFSIADGTLLGAVRHKGFIPWDDDIDIYMLREDYEKFDKLFPLLLDGKYEMLSLSKNNKWHKTFAKVIDIRTKMVNVKTQTIPYGIGIDVFPIDDVPENIGKWKSFMRNVRIIHKIVDNKARRISKERTFINNLGIFVLNILLAPIRLKILMKWSNKYIQRFNGCGYSKCYEVAYGPDLKSPFPKQLFENMVEWPFEDRKYYGFKDADIFLSCSYGNYMELPPEDKRIPHSEVAYWID